MKQKLLICDICNKPMLVFDDELPKGWSHLNSSEWSYDICPSCLAEVDCKMEELKEKHRKV